MSFRSEEMALCQFFFLSDVAYSCVSELGELGLVQFKDLNGNKVDFERKFVNEVRRCAEMERIFVYLKTQINRYGIAARKFREHTNLEAPHPKEMVDLEAILENLEYEIQNDNKNTRTLENNYMKLFELKHILQKNDLLDEISRQDSSSEDELQSTSELLSEEGKRDGKGFKFCFFVGVINQDRMQAFEKMIWRISLGNTFFRQSPISERIQNLETDVYEYKSAFIIIFQGEILKKKIETICKGFRASLYPCPEKAVDRRNMSINVMERLHELNTILKQTLEHRTRVLKATANNINEWTIKVKKMKAIFVTLNKFEANMTDKCFIGEGWVPVRYMDTIHLALQQAAMRSGSSMRPILTRIETDSTPPTYHKTNKFTAGFQALIDSYGIGTYQEINPTPFTIITFPFLFAIMFGDIGHGSILFLFASWMCLYEKRLIKQDIRNEVWEYFFGGRYIILLMGIFSIYTGFIYNDLFSKSLNIFGTSWSVNVTNIIGQSKTMKSNETITLNPATSEYYGSPYVLGMDPIWEIADNKILFHNSFKMKISIIVGIFQMLFGVFLSLLNYLFFRSKINIIALFIPQVIFLSALFLYMVFLMFIKWILYYPTDNPNEVQSSEYCAPLILITFINMVLFKETVVSRECALEMYSGQFLIQNIFVFVAVFSVPVMLFLKPCYIWRQRRIEDNIYSNENQQRKSADKTKNIEKEDLTEIFIHQSIHTIEYVLGSISHTASYLRLWALSLAHGQLSDVLWKMVLHQGLASFASLNIVIRVIFLYLVFAFWAVFTLCILVLMEGLSAFLHCLRLHWVEFQSKFYSGSGNEFCPFTFKPLLKNDQD